VGGGGGGGGRGAWRSVVGGGAPFSQFATGSLLEADPELGYRYNRAHPGINSLGLRGPEVAREKTAGRKRLIVLGDSVAAPEDGFVGIVAARLGASWEVINAAVPGYTTYQERLLLERELLALRPDVVVVQYCLNDNHRFLHRFDAGDRMLFTEEARRALAGGWLARHSYLAFRARLAWMQVGRRGGEWPWEDQPDVAVAWEDESWGPQEEHLRAMRDGVRAVGGRLAVVMAPYRPQLDPRLEARDRAYVRKPQAKMAEICRKAGVPLLDLAPVLREDLFTDHYHFSRAGHEAVAVAVAEFLVRERLVELP